VQYYPVPYLPTGEEKLIAGFMSARQGAYVIGGAVLGVLLFRAGAGVASVLPLAVAAAVSFVEHPRWGMRLDRLLVHLVRYEAGPKSFANRGIAAPVLGPERGRKKRWLPF